LPSGKNWEAKMDAMGKWWANTGKWGGGGRTQSIGRDNPGTINEKNACAWGKIPGGKKGGVHKSVSNRNVIQREVGKKGTQEHLDRRKNESPSQNKER